MKTCAKCQIDKPLCEFGVDRSSADSRARSCKLCTAARSREVYAANPASRQRSVAKRREADPVAYRISRQKEHLKQKYGLTLEMIARMKAEQAGACAICRREVKLIVDHNHTTGKVRSLLCQRCNVGIGYFEESPILLQRALDYVIPAPPQMPR